MGTLCTVCNHYPCPGCLGAAHDEIGRLRVERDDLKRALVYEEGEQLKRAIAALEWYADFGQGAAKEPAPPVSAGVALGALHHDGGKRALVALGRA